MTFHLSFYSNDPGSKANGGNFGWVSRGDFVPEFDAIAYTIPLNTISNVFESPFGFHILKIEKRRGDQYYGSHILLKNEISEQDLADLKEKCISISGEIKSQKITWQKALTKYSTLKNASANGLIFNEANGDMYWDMQNIDKSLFIGINNLEIGQYSEPLYYEDSKGNIGYRILKLEDRTVPHKANLSDDYEYIQQFALNEKQSKTMDEWVHKSAKNTFIKVDDLFKNCSQRKKWNLNW